MTTMIDRKISKAYLDNRTICFDMVTTAIDTELNTKEVIVTPRAIRIPVHNSLNDVASIHMSFEALEDIIDMIAQSVNKVESPSETVTVQINGKDYLFNGRILTLSYDRICSELGIDPNHTPTIVCIIPGHRDRSIVRGESIPLVDKTNISVAFTGNA